MFEHQSRVLKPTYRRGFVIASVSMVALVVIVGLTVWTGGEASSPDQTTASDTPTMTVTLKTTVTPLSLSAREFSGQAFITTNREAGAASSATATRTATPRPRIYVPLVADEPTYTPTRTPSPTITPTPSPRTQLRVGVNSHDQNYELIRGMGFQWVKLYTDWDGGDADSLVNDALSRYPSAKILLRIDKSPSGARTGNNSDPLNGTQWRAYLFNLATRLKGKVLAYELFNEPNLQYEWNAHIAGGSGSPSAAGFTQIMKVGYRAIKDADANAIVVSGGLSSAGNGGPGSIGDLIFIDQMYDAGISSAIDALGSHPYGGPFTWSAGQGDSGGIYFFRALEQHQRMVSRGDNTHQIWATEMGWLVDPRVYGYQTYAGRDCFVGLGGRTAWVRSPSDVATQLDGAYRYAADNWSWMGAMFLFNFDYSAAGWVSTYDKVCDAPSWYSIVSKGNMPPRPATEPAYDRLRQFARDYGLTR